MKIPSFIKDPICKLLNHEAGVLFQGLFGALIGWVVSFLANHGLQLDPQVASHLQSLCMETFAGIVIAGTQAWQTGNAKAVQAMLNEGLKDLGITPLDNDGWHGPKTLAAAEVIVRKATLAEGEVLHPSPLTALRMDGSHHPR